MNKLKEVVKTINNIDTIEMINIHAFNLFAATNKQSEFSSDKDRFTQVQDEKTKSHKTPLVVV